MSTWVLKHKNRLKKNTGEEEAISIRNFKFGSTSEAGRGCLLRPCHGQLQGTDITVDFGMGSGLQKGKIQSLPSRSLELKTTRSHSFLWS